MTNGVMFATDEYVFITGKPVGTENSVFQPPLANLEDLTFYGQGLVSLAAFTPVSFTFEAAYINSFFDDWYNRIHLIPVVVNLNNVITDQTREITLWNAYLTNKTLTSTVFPTVQGV